MNEDAVHQTCPRAHLSLVPLVALGAVVGPLIRVGTHVLAHVPNGLVELATLAALVPPLTHVHVHVLLQKVTRQELLLAQRAPEGLVAWGGRRKRLDINVKCRSEMVSFENIEEDLCIELPS